MRKRLLALGLSLFSCCALGELLVRLLVAAPMAERLPVLVVRSNPWRGWEMMPSTPHYTYHHRVRVNALGLRGSEVPERKGDELRLLALGDSLVYGQGVGDEETLPYYLERELERRAGGRQRWRVVNGGHRGYSTNQELGLLRELGPRIRPDVVVLFWYWNDLSEPRIAGLARRLGESGPITFDVNARLEGVTLLKWRAKQLARRSALVMYLYDAWRAARAGGIDAGMAERALGRLDGYLGELAELARAGGFRPVLAVVPESVSIARPHPSEAVARRALELARGHGLEPIELIEPLRALYERTGSVPILPFDGHYDPAANRAMAEHVAGIVLR